MSLRRIKHTLINLAEQTSLLRLAQLPRHEAGNHLFVLTYHRVAEIDTPLESSLYDLVTATIRQFDQQMKLVASCFQPVHAEEVLNALDGGKPLPPQAVLVTVDDGYRDFQETIFPIVKRHGITPVLFLPTAFVGNGIFWWDRLANAIRNTPLQAIDTPLGHFSLIDAQARQAAFDTLANHVRLTPFDEARQMVETVADQIANPGQPYVLDWDELRALAKKGAVIASHTHNHPILTHIPLEKARQEIRISRALIQQHISQPLPIFAYPDGREHAVSNELAAMLKEEGIEMAFTMRDKISSLKGDPPQLSPRLVPDRSLSLAQFHLRLTALRA